MVKCLAVNTANALMSLAVMEDDEILHAWQSEETRNQGNLLLQHVGEGLKAAGLGYGDLDLLAVVTGPGSFTGIRIGLAAMRGLAMAAGLPLAGVSSFDFYAAPQEGYLNIIALESWREELYFQAVDAKGVVIIPPVNETMQDFAERLDLAGEADQPLFITGDAAEKCFPMWPWGELAKTGPVTAEAAGRIAMKRMAEQGVESFAERPGPFYLRPPDVTVSSKK
ncbi:MAG: tRNA (adenosine(37)-N6)-threonylcarbamoyltransferase complex dimerization subunit type 1 TsaB [Alphaproteobacteria bacterium]|nr:tRNA (adenosine(37)-N6)-threonylcarbamoyltransferase complex dimerization subunit type 1 TsaB [Alphaproteobacteria bacterium]